MKRPHAAGGFLALQLLIGLIATAQPPTGVWEGEIEDRTRPQVITIDFDRAVASFDGGDSLSVSVPAVGPESAVDFEIRRGAGAIRFSGTRSGGTISGTLRAAGREIPFTVSELPTTRAEVSRTVAWEQDLDAVAQRFLRYDRSFSPAAHATAIGRLAALKSAISRQTDQQILVELARIVALGDNAHTRLYFVRNRTEVRRLPIRGWWFGPEFRIVRASTEHRDLLGCRVLHIGEVDIDAAFRTVQDLKAGSTSWRRYMAAYYLTSPDVLFGASVIDSAERATLEMECEAGRQRRTFDALPLQRAVNTTESWWDLVPDHPRVDASFRSALDRASAPLYLQHPGENYWSDYLDDLKAVYVQYNRAEAMPNRSIPAFAEHVAQTIADRKPSACIIDLRFNTGGNLDIGTPLVDRLAPLCHPQRVFILTGRATFSAGITHAAQWKQATGGTIIGEPVGDRLDFWSEGGNMVLPHSRLTLHYANAFHRYSTIDYPERRPYYFELSVASLEPDLIVEPTWDDYINGRDPVMDVVAGQLR